MKKLNSNQLKIIAITAMTIDHFAWIFFPGFQKDWYILLFHVIGRITTPIMCFFIVEGYNHTKNLKKYILRLFLFAIISHFAYCFAFNNSYIPHSVFNATSIIWSLAWAVILLAVFDSKINRFLKILLMAFILIITVPSDWNFIPVFIIFFMNKYRGNFKKQMLMMILGIVLFSITYYVLWDKTYCLIQLYACLSIPLLYLYNGERGKLNLKYLFYIYYPLHLVILGVINLIRIS